MNQYPKNLSVVILVVHLTFTILRIVRRRPVKDFKIPFAIVSFLLVQVTGAVGGPHK